MILHDLDDLLYLVREYVPACPTKTMKRAMNQAVRTFCYETRWVREMQQIDSVADQDLYELEAQDASDDFEVCGVRAVEHDRRVLIPTGPEETQFDDTSGTPVYYWFNPENQLRLIPAPSVAGTANLWVSMWLQPKVTSDCVPDSVIRGNERVIRNGTLALLYDMNNKPWGDAAKAQARAAEFENDLSRAGYRADITHRPHNFRTKAWV